MYSAFSFGLGRVTALYKWSYYYYYYYFYYFNIWYLAVCKPLFVSMISIQFFYEYVSVSRNSSRRRRLVRDCSARWKSKQQFSIFFKGLSFCGVFLEVVIYNQ